MATRKQVKEMIELSEQLNEKNPKYYDIIYFTGKLRFHTERLDGNLFNAAGFISELKQILQNQSKRGGKSKKRNQKKTKKRRGQKKSKKQQRRANTFLRK